MAVGRRSRAVELLPTDLTPLAAEAVRLYLDPLMPTFGNRAAACRAAGSKAIDPGRILDTPAAVAEIERIQTLRAEQGRKVAEYLGDYAFDAARELVQQLSTGRDLELIDPREVLNREVQHKVVPVLDDEGAETGEWTVDTLGLTDIELDRVKHVVAHNKTVLAAAKERREAAKLLLAYKIGTPEQRVKVTSEKKLPGVVDLEDLSKTELDELGKIVRQARKARAGAKVVAAAASGPIAEAEYTIEE